MSSSMDLKRALAWSGEMWESGLAGAGDCWASAKEEAAQKMSAAARDAELRSDGKGLLLLLWAKKR